MRQGAPARGLQFNGARKYSRSKHRFWENLCASFEKRSHSPSKNRSNCHPYRNNDEYQGAPVIGLQPRQDGQFSRRMDSFVVLETTPPALQTKTMTAFSLSIRRIRKTRRRRQNAAGAFASCNRLNCNLDEQPVRNITARDRRLRSAILRWRTGRRIMCKVRCTTPYPSGRTSPFRGQPSVSGGSSTIRRSIVCPSSHNR